MCNFVQFNSFFLQFAKNTLKTEMGNQSFFTRSDIDGIELTLLGGDT
jgi:hypothetical protein